MSILKTEKGKEIISHITLKNVQSHQGMEGMTLYAEFYLDKKKMGVFNDDARGGSCDISFLSPTHKSQFGHFLMENNTAQLMIDNGWNFIERARITLDDQAEEVIDAAFELIQKTKAEKKIEKACLMGVVYGTDEYYSTSAYRTPLKELVELHKEKAVETIQGSYDRIKSCLKKDERIFNTNLEELGIKL